MPLRTCPDCGKEVSTSAASCPNCGHPFQTQPVEEKVVYNDPPAKETVPKWVVFPVVILVAVLIVLFLLLFRGGDDPAEENINVDIAAERQNTDQTDVPDRSGQTTVDPAPPSTMDLPDSPNQADVPADTQAQVTDPPEEGGTVSLDARIADKKGNISPVEDEKFYLLDKDLETILREARLQPIQNQTLVNSFGLSVIYPDRYKEFNQKALKAINDHIKYETLTNDEGRAEMRDVEPKSYYLFGIHKVGNGFAIWSSQVTIRPGQNKLNIQPQRATEISG